MIQLNFWLSDWLIDWLIGCLVLTLRLWIGIYGWETYKILRTSDLENFWHFFVYWMLNWLIDWLINWLIDWLVGSNTYFTDVHLWPGDLENSLRICNLKILCFLFCCFLNVKLIDWLIDWFTHFCMHTMAHTAGRSLVWVYFFAKTCILAVDKNNIPQSKIRILTPFSLMSFTLIHHWKVMPSKDIHTT